MSIIKRCKHEWEVIVNEYEKSQWEKSIEKFSKVQGLTMPEDAFLGKKIIILQCKKCGKLNKTIKSV